MFFEIIEKKLIVGFLQKRIAQLIFFTTEKFFPEQNGPYLGDMIGKNRE